LEGRDRGGAYLRLSGMRLSWGVGQKYTLLLKREGVGEGMLWFVSNGHQRSDDSRIIGLGARSKGGALAAPSGKGKGVRNAHNWWNRFSPMEEIDEPESKSKKNQGLEGSAIKTDVGCRPEKGSKKRGAFRRGRLGELNKKRIIIQKRRRRGLLP